MNVLLDDALSKLNITSLYTTKFKIARTLTLSYQLIEMILSLLPS